MTRDEAIKHCEEKSCENRKLAKRYDDASGYTRSGNEDVRTSDAKKCERCAKEHNQLAEWLKDYKRLLEQEPCEDCISREAVLDAISRIGFRKNDTKEVQAVAECLRAVEDLPQESCLKMRPATKQERESVNAYIDSISTPTGYTFWGKDGK